MTQKPTFVDIAKGLKKAERNEPLEPELLNIAIRMGLLIIETDGSYSTTIEGDEFCLKYLPINENPIPETKDEIEFQSIENILREEIKPINWLVEEWIPEGSITLLCGKQGSYKSYMSQYMAFCLSNGLEWLGFKVKKVNKIVVLDVENDKDTIHERFSFFKKGYEVNDGLNIAYYQPEILKMTDETKYNALIEKFESEKPDVLIIDTLIRVAGIPENHAEDVSDFYQQKLKPLLKVVPNIIILHHLKKAFGENTEMVDLVRGSTDWVAFPQVVLGLKQNTRVNNKFYLYQYKLRRRAKHKPISLQLDADDPQTYVRFNRLDEDVSMSQTYECYEEIVAWFKENDIREFTSGEKGDLGRFAKPDGKYNYVVIDKARRLLESDGKIEKVTKGRYLVCLTK